MMRSRSGPTRTRQNGARACRGPWGTSYAPGGPKRRHLCAAVGATCAGAVVLSDGLALNLPIYPHANSFAADVFIDGAYLREEFKGGSAWRIQPALLAHGYLVNTPWRGKPIMPSRYFWFDAVGKDDTEVRDYLKRVELQPDTAVEEGRVVGGPKRRQKGVDGRLAVVALSGAYRRVFDVAIIVAGDADFVPLVTAIREVGPLVVVAGFQGSMAEELRRVADRVIPLPDISQPFWPQIALPAL